MATNQRKQKRYQEKVYQEAKEVGRQALEAQHEALMDLATTKEWFDKISEAYEALQERFDALQAAHAVCRKESAQQKIQIAVLRDRYVSAEKITRISKKRLDALSQDENDVKKLRRRLQEAKREIADLHTQLNRVNRPEEFRGVL